MSKITYKQVRQVVDRFHAQGILPQAGEIAARFNGWTTRDDPDPVHTGDILEITAQMVRDKQLVVEYEIRGKSGSSGNSKLREVMLFRLPDSPLRPMPCTSACVGALLGQVEWISYEEFLQRYGHAPTNKNLFVAVGEADMLAPDIASYQDACYLFGAQTEATDMVKRALDRLETGETNGRGTK